MSHFRTPMAKTADMRRPYQIAAALLFALAAYVCRESLQLSYYSSLGPGAGFFSFWLSLILGTLAIALFVQATFRTSEPRPADFLADRIGYLRMGAVVIALLAAALLLEHLGFRLTMLGMYLFIMAVLGIHNVLVTLLIALGGSFGTYYVFVHWLSVPLPVGALGV